MKKINENKQMKSVWYDIRWDHHDTQVLLEIMPPSREEKSFGKHPTQKPLMLLERLILAASDPNDLVFDPFMGSGTTAVAAKKLKRKFVGCELDAKYVEIAIKRLNEIDDQQKYLMFNLEKKE